MNAVIFIGQSTPEKDLKKSLHFKSYLTEDQKGEIMKELLKNLPSLEDDEYSVTMHIDIQVRVYERKKPEEEFWYNSKINK